MRVKAYYDKSPRAFATAVYTVVVNRNPSKPEFTKRLYEERIKENHPVGNMVVNVTAEDLDGDRLTYEIVPEHEYFYILPYTGEISLRKSLFNLPNNVNIMEFLVRTGDNDQRNEQYDTANVRIHIQRGVKPTFNRDSYTVTIDESKQLEENVQPVSASSSSVLVCTQFLYLHNAL